MIELEPVGIDVETTGLYIRSCQVIQVGVAYRNFHGDLQIKEMTCDPGEKYLGKQADQALSVNKITREEISHSPPIDEVANCLKEVLFDIVGDVGPIQLIAYNRQFDKRFLSAQPWYVLDGWWGECAMLRAQSHFGLKKWPKLDEAVKLANLEWEGEAHKAGADAAMALRLWEFMDDSSLLTVPESPSGL